MSNWEEHLLWSVAQEEISEATPHGLSKKAFYRLADVHELMTLAWIRGAEWAAGNPELAQVAYEDANKRRASEKT